MDQKNLMAINTHAHFGELGAHGTCTLVEERGVKGFKFQPTARSFDPYDKTGEAISLAMHKPVG